MPSRLRPSAAFAALLFAAAFAAPPAQAASWSEPAFAPAVGSRWLIESDTDTVTVKSAGPQHEHVHMTGELTFAGKTAAGYRVVYVMRDITVEGASQSAALMRNMMRALRGVTVRGSTDAKGKPVSVENLDEVRAAFRKSLDSLMESLKGKGRAAAVINQAMSGFLTVQGTQAAEFYLGELTQLAAWQNTGLKPGDVRRETPNQQSPIGGNPIKVNIETRIDKADATTGDVRYMRTRSFDTEALKDWTLDLVKRLQGDKLPAAELEKVFKQLTMSMDMRATIAVKGGMTRLIDEQEDLVVSAMGVSFSKREHKETKLKALQ